MPSNRRDALLAEYGEVSSNFRMLTDIRFKLLAFLPVTAGAAAAVLARGNANMLTLAFSLFGLVVTIGLVTYNSRNDELYDALVARAAAIERNLGVPDGAFANRPRPLLRHVGHRTAVAAIYEASIALWLFGVLHAVVNLAQHTLYRWIRPTWLDLIALLAAAGLTILGGRLVGRERKRTDNRLRKAAAVAVNMAEKLGVTQLGDSKDFLLLCEHLAGAKAEIIETRARFLSQLQSDAVAHYVASGSPQWTAAQTVAVITDLAPEWLYDCATGRRSPA